MAGKIYLVYRWDSMASNWGDYCLVAVYDLQDKADARAETLNASAEPTSPRAFVNFHEVE